MKRILSSASLALLGLACSAQTTQDETPSDSPKKTESCEEQACAKSTVRRNEPFRLDRFFGELSRQCIADTGHGLDALNYTCSCDAPDAERLGGSVYVPGAGCHPITRPSSCAATPGGFSDALAQGGVAALAACTTDSGGFEGSYPASTGVHFLLPASGPRVVAQAQALASWADRMWGPSSRGLPGLWPSADLGGNELYVQIGPPSETLVKTAVSAAILPSFQIASVSNAPYIRVVVEPDANELDFVLGARVADLRVLHRLSPAPPFGAGSPEKDAYEATLASIEGPLGTTFVTGERLSNPDNGCASLCSVRTEGVTLASGAQAYRERIYSFGSIARDALWVTRKDDVVALVLLAPGGTAGVTLTFSTTSSASAVRTRLTVYDRTWNVLAPPQLLTQAWPEDFATRFRRKASDGPALANIVTCDGRFAESLASTEAADDVAIGPNPAVFSEAGKLERGSLLGWFPNANGGSMYFAREPVATLSGFWPLGSTLADPNLHAATVWKAAQDQARSLGKHFGFIPMSIETCFKELDAWLPSVSGCASERCPRPLARVANVSIADYEMSRVQCEDTAGLKLAQTEESMFWVIAAGNGYTSAVGRDTPKNGCPGTLGEHKNAVVVSALDGDNGDNGGDLWSHSDYGARYSDIAADGRLGSDVGTSLAAPRVAAVAATLTQDFPSLSPFAMRVALLLSAAPVASLASKVRSGGKLNSPVAREVASCLSGASGMIDRSHAESCLRGSSYVGDVGAKVALLADRGLFTSR